MTGKSRIIDLLGERGLLLPKMVNAALAANDRLKYRLSLLQTARYFADHADQGVGPPPDLRAERLAAAIDDETLDRFALAATPTGRGHYRMPAVSELCAQIDGELEAMLAPLTALGDAPAAAFAARLTALREKPWCDDGDGIDAAAIEQLASGDRRHGDSAHLLVMDMHKALNAMQARIASTTIDGAHVYDLAAGDPPLVAAFMSGVGRTAPLKFDHPGLGTTATRSGARLVIQNDIGTTDAHVIVVHVEGLVATVTYTDVHMQRLLYFQSLFADWKVDWEDTRSRAESSLEDGVFHLCSGRFEAEDRDRLAAYLAFVGSRLVFLIDWNRARKRLRLLLAKEGTLQLLKWAADNDVGHMAFLRAGGEQAIFDAIGFVAGNRISVGSRLDELLGEGPAMEFMRFALRTCAHGLLKGRSEALIHDELRAEMMNYFHSAQQNLLDVAADHAALALEIAAGLRDCLAGAGAGAGADGAAGRFATNAERAKAWEHRADERVNQARGMVRQGDRAEFFRSLVETADDIADELEEAAFHLTVVPGLEIAPEVAEPLLRLAGQVVAGTQEYVKALETARGLKRGASREDMHDVLEAVHRIVNCEQGSDRAQRAVKIALMTGAENFRELYAVDGCARNLEAAADALMHTGLALRDHVLGEVMAE